MDTHLEPADLVVEQNRPDRVGPDIARKWLISEEGHEFVTEHDLKTNVVSVEEAAEHAIKALETAESVESSLHNQRVKLDRWKDKFQTMRDDLTREKHKDGSRRWKSDRNNFLINKSVKPDLKDLKGTVKDLESDVDELEMSMADARNNHEDLFERVTKNLQSLEKSLDNLEDDLHGIADRVDEQESRIASLEERMDHQERGLFSKISTR